MIRMLFLFVSFLSLTLVMGIDAKAAGGAGAGVAGASRDSSWGLCLDQNKNEVQVQKHYCDDITKALTSGCVGQEAERLRQQVESEASGSGAGPMKGIGDYCQNWRSVSHDQTKFQGFLKNLLAGLALKESTWGEKKREKKYANVKKTNGHGIFQLDGRDSVNGCACSGLTDKSAMDAKVNIPCGVHIALKWMIKDNAIGEGSVQNKTGRGIARYYGTFGDRFKEKREDIASKVEKSYCEPSTRDGKGKSSSGTSVGMSDTIREIICDGRSLASL
jgi:hypothetical protein